MRPRRLEVQGFTAFRDLQTIDFRELDLFVITGPTGAGKTTLLDAMALALYGQVPRMGKHGLGQLVSHGMAEARVLLEFSVAGDEYRVSRRLPRSGSQQGRFERFEAGRWVDAVERGGITAINIAIVKLVKLEFESFCKAILLPQGEFARFLKGDPGERRKTLVALLGLSAYDRMGALARERAKELRIKGEQTRTILAEQFANATPEALVVAQNAVGVAAVAAGHAADRFAEARAFERRRAESSAHEQTAAALSERFDALTTDLRGESEACASVAGAYERAEARRAQAVADAAAAAADCASAEKRRDEVRAQYGGRDELARLTDAIAQRTTLNQRVTDTETLVAAAARSMADRAVDVERGAAAEMQAKAELEAARVAESQARADCDHRAAERDRLRRRVDDASNAAAEHESASKQLAELDRQASEAEAAASTASDAETQAQQRLQVLQREHVVAHLVADLDAGDPCPVCDKPLDQHPVADHDTHERLADAAALVESMREAGKIAQQHAADTRAAVRATNARVALAASALAAALGEAADMSALEVLMLQADDNAARGASALAVATTDLETALARTQAAAVALAKARSELDGAAREHKLHHDNLAQAVGDGAAALALLQARFGQDVPADAAEQIRAALGELVAAQARADAARQADAAARAALTDASNEQQTALAAVTAVDLRVGQLRTRVEAAIEHVAALPGAPALTALPPPSEARDSHVIELADWCSTAAGAFGGAARAFEAATVKACRELVALALSRNLNADDAATALASLEAAERHATAARVRAEETANSLAERAEQRQKLEAKIATEAIQIAVLQILATELRADHFIDFVVQETLDVLAVHASEELLRISDGRYSLISSSGDFSVVDHVNADEQRSVKTLSGGETFMASLSLALALSKHVSELAGEGLGARLEAVFIDEGFGALDPETLQEVIDALERLREDDLLIGIISHVPALAERIGVGPQVRKDGNSSVVLTTTGGSIADLDLS